jgi:D-lactate dehydrogenase
MSMKIVYCAPYEGERDLAEAALEGHEVIFTDQPVRTEIPEEGRDAEAVSVFVDSVVTKEMIDSMPNLKVIALRSTGFDHVDYAYAKEKGITVSYVPHYGSQTVAEYAFALMLALSRKAYAAYDALRSDGSRDVKKYEGFDLKGKTLGVVGTGAIGRHSVSIAQGFGMNVIAFDLYPNEEYAAESGIVYKGSIQEVLAEADLVTLHVPSSPENHHMINAESLAGAKKGIYVINTARGDLVDTVALTQAIVSGQVAGAGLDVYEGEKFIVDEMELLAPDTTIPEDAWKAFAAEHALLDMPNVIVTPHVAFNSREAKKEITDTTAENILKAFAGEAQNEVAQ